MSGTSSYTGTFTTTFTYTGTITASTITVGTLSTNSTGNGASGRWKAIDPQLVKDKYSVRCLGCGRWAKILKKMPGYKMYRIECKRCLNHADGLAY